MKINVVGTSGSGKSTFSKKLTRKINHSYIEMDELNWKSNWVESTNKDFFEKLKKNYPLKTGYLMEITSKHRI